MNNITISEVEKQYGISKGSQAKVRSAIKMKMNKSEVRGRSINVYSPSQFKALLSHNNLFLCECKKDKTVLAKFIRGVKS